MVGKTGFEPATPWSQTKCSTKLSHFPIYMVRSKGFEPLTFWFVAKHSIQLSYERMPRCFLRWWLQRELNQRHKDFQSSALPTELWSQKKWRSRRESNSRSSAWQADVITATPRDHIWLREMDLNQRPLGYEPNELPSCSIPRYNLQTSYGGERGIRTPAPSPTSRFSRPVPSTRLGYFSKIRLTKLIITHYFWLVNKIK